jgi:UDP-2,3-diacylglucosamine pyrophosphatase LpxH
MKMIENHDTTVIYTRGNHDDFLDSFIPLQIGKNLIIQRDYIHESCGKKYLVTHGDVFDSITQNMKWLSKLGDIGYTFLLWLNKKYNNYRTRRGLPYYSLSQVVKAKVKSAVSYISDFEKNLVEYAANKGCTGIICGHIHQPANKYFGDFHYMNSGDWVESLTALTEDYSGEWNLVYYNETVPFKAMEEHEAEDELLVQLEEIELAFINDGFESSTHDDNFTALPQL